MLALATAASLICNSGSFATCASVNVSVGYQQDQYGNYITTIDLAQHVYQGELWFHSFGGRIFDSNDPSSWIPENLLSYEEIISGDVRSPTGYDQTDASWEAWTDANGITHRRYESWPHIYDCSRDPYTISIGWQTCGDGQVIYRWIIDGHWTDSDIAFWYNNSSDCIVVNNTPDPACGAITQRPTSVTPEPSTWLMLTTGMIAIFVIRRKINVHSSIL